MHPGVYLPEGLQLTSRDAEPQAHQDTPGLQPPSSQAQLVPRGPPSKSVYSCRHVHTQMMGERSNPLFTCCRLNYFPRCWPGFKVEDKREQNPGQLRPEFKNRCIDHDSGTTVQSTLLCAKQALEGAPREASLLKNLPSTWRNLSRTETQRK